MTPMLVGFILILTITTAMALGVVLGYGLFTGLLHLLGRQSHPAAATPELAHSQASSGD